MFISVMPSLTRIYFSLKNITTRKSNSLITKPTQTILSVNIQSVQKTILVTAYPIHTNSSVNTLLIRNIGSVMICKTHMLCSIKMPSIQKLRSVKINPVQILISVKNKPIHNSPSVIRKQNHTRSSVNTLPIHISNSVKTTTILNSNSIRNLRSHIIFAVNE